MKKSTYLFLLVIAVSQYACMGSSSRPSEPVRSGFPSAIVISGDTLFTLDNNKVAIFDISDERSPERRTEISATGKNSILVHQDYLYLIHKKGSSIWDIHEPSFPVEVGENEDLRGCGQTIAEETTAYSAMQWNRSCDDFTNRLEIVDLSDPRNPQKISEYSLAEPSSLLKIQHVLAVCERFKGVNFLDVENPEHIQDLLRIDGTDCSDMADGPDTLVFRGWDGIYQYQVSDEGSQQISKIPTGLN